jgi:hypothetical protein
LEKVWPEAIRMLEVSDRRQHPLRLEVHNFFFVQAIAGPHRSVVMGGFLHAMQDCTAPCVILSDYAVYQTLPCHKTAHRAVMGFLVAALKNVWCHQKSPSLV